MAGPVLVTGAAGFAGGHLLDLLSRDRDPALGGHLVAWHRPGGAAPRDVPGVSWEPVDLLDRASVHAAARSPQAVAGRTTAPGAAHVGRSWQTTEATFAVNVRGTHHLLDGAAAERSPRRASWWSSSAMVYAPRIEAADRGRSARAGEPLRPQQAGAGDGRARPIPTARPRRSPAPFNHFGPRQDPFFVAAGFARRIADIEAGRWEPEIAVGNLEARRDLTDVRDTVRAYRAIVERGQPGRAYNVCSGHAIVIRDLLDMLIARARVPVRVRVDPARYRPNDTPLVVGDPSRLRNELGWTPQIPLEQTVDDLLQYWRER